MAGEVRGNPRKDLRCCGGPGREAQDSHSSHRQYRRLRGQAEEAQGGIGFQPQGGRGG